jgi:hypothetical protein
MYGEVRPNTRKQLISRQKFIPKAKFTANHKSVSQSIYVTTNQYIDSNSVFLHTRTVAIYQILTKLVSRLGTFTHRLLGNKLEPIVANYVPGQGFVIFSNDSKCMRSISTVSDIQWTIQALSSKDGNCKTSNITSNFPEAFFLAFFLLRITSNTVKNGQKRERHAQK